MKHQNINNTNHSKAKNKETVTKQCLLIKHAHHIGTGKKSSRISTAGVPLFTGMYIYNSAITCCLYQCTEMGNSKIVVSAIHSLQCYCIDIGIDLAPHPITVYQGMGYGSLTGMRVWSG